MSSVARACGKSPGGLKQSIDRAALPAKDLEKIIAFLEIPLSDIFDELPIESVANESPETYTVKGKYIEQRLAEVERDLNRLKEKIEKGA